MFHSQYRSEHLKFQFISRSDFLSLEALSVSVWLGFARWVNLSFIYIWNSLLKNCLVTQVPKNIRIQSPSVEEFRSLFDLGVYFSSYHRSNISSCVSRSLISDFFNAFERSWRARFKVFRGNSLQVHSFCVTTGLMKKSSWVRLLVHQLVRSYRIEYSRLKRRQLCSVFMRSRKAKKVLLGDVAHW